MSQQKGGEMQMQIRHVSINWFGMKKKATRSVILSEGGGKRYVTHGCNRVEEFEVANWKPNKLFDNHQ